MKKRSWIFVVTVAVIAVSVVVCCLLLSGENRSIAYEEPFREDNAVLPPAVFVNDRLYRSTSYPSGYSQISEECTYLGEITECVGVGNVPRENFQANHAPVGTKVYQYYSVILLEEEGKYYAYAAEETQMPKFLEGIDTLRVSYHDMVFAEETGSLEEQVTEIALTEAETEMLRKLLEPYENTFTTDVLKLDYLQYYCIEVNDTMTFTVDPQCGNYGENGDSYMFMMEHTPGAVIKGTYIDGELVEFLKEVHPK